MAKVLPLGQSFFDLKSGEQIGITRVRMASSADHVQLPAPAFDAVVLGATEAERTALQFYLGGGSKSNVFNIDGATAGQEFVVASRHGNFVNFGSE